MPYLRGKILRPECSVYSPQFSIWHGRRDSQPPTAPLRREGAGVPCSWVVTATTGPAWSPLKSRVVAKSLDISLAVMRGTTLDSRFRGNDKQRGGKNPSCPRKRASSMQPYDFATALRLVEPLLDKFGKSGTMSVVESGNQDRNRMKTRTNALELLLAQLLEQRSNSCVGEAGARGI